MGRAVVVSAIPIRGESGETRQKPRFGKRASLSGIGVEACLILIFRRFALFSCEMFRCVCSVVIRLHVL